MEDKTHRYAIAVDLGTTTIGLSLVNTGSKEVAERTFVENPQREWGSDILSRVSAIEREPTLLDTMQKATVRVCEEAMEGLLRRAGVREEQLATIHCAGNPVMEHIFLGISPLGMARVPYRPAFRKVGHIGAERLGFDLPRHVVVYTFPLVSGFVGGDAVASLFALPEREDLILIDIGTNSEIILSLRGTLYATSAPAGSVFEGGQIGCGLPPVEGAIDRVDVTEESVRVRTIGGLTPVGITGSAFVEAVAGLIRHGVINGSGRIKEPDEIPCNLAARVKKVGAKNAFSIFRALERELLITQDDVRAFQLAKASIRAATEVLLERAGAGKDEIKRVYVTGSFGVRLRRDVLTTTGIVDTGLQERIEFLEEGALRGVELSLTEDGAIERIETLADSIRHVPLSGTRAFEREFPREINF